MITLGALAAELGRTVEGDAGLEIDGVAALEEAGPRQLVFVRSGAQLPRLARSGAAAVIAPAALDVGGRAAIRSPHPGLDFARAARRLEPAERPAPGVHPSAVLDPGARVDPSASVGPGCWLGARVEVGPRSALHAGVSLYPGVRVGADCTLHAHCVLRDGTTLGQRVVLHPGVVLGADGFGYVGDERGGLEKAPQRGGVWIGDDVEIGANSCVDRGSLGDTRIGAGSVIDNLVQIGHNCVIGEGVVIVSQAGLAGSTRVEDGAVVLAQAGLAGHLTVGAGAVVGPQAGVHRDVAPGSRVYGSPQREERTQHRLMAALGRLPELLRRVRAIERRLGLRPDGGPPGQP